MTNSKVFLIKGWKIEGSELVDELLNKLDEVSEDYYEEFFNDIDENHDLRDKMKIT